MPLIIKGKTYTLPKEKDQQGPTGREIIEIEKQFELDGMGLLQSLTEANPPAGYTKVKALYAFAWIAISRSGEVVSIADVLNDYAVDDFEFVDEEEVPKEQTEG